MNGNLKLFLLAGLLVGLALAVFVSPLASGSPDGLEKVAKEQGFADTAADHALAGSPVAGYSVRGISGESMSTGAAGLIGTLLTFGLGVAVFGLVRRGRSRSESA